MIPIFGFEIKIGQTVEQPKCCQQILVTDFSNGQAVEKSTSIAVQKMTMLAIKSAVLQPKNSLLKFVNL